jgi:D-glycero-beta-D-manno-heptose 1-phosphate adenylyltransferase
MPNASLHIRLDQDIKADAMRVLVKGGDYDMRQLPEAKLVESYGGKALALSFVDGYSTTALVRRIRG